MILAADIGGTNSRLAAFNHRGTRLELHTERVYSSSQHSGLAEIVRDFISTEGIPVTSASFGVAGPVRRGVSKISNLPWTIDARELASQLRLPRVGLINDLEALAYGIDVLESKDFVTICCEGAQPEGNAAVVSAGSGLGESCLYWDGHRHHPFASEGGHSEYAAKNPEEVELLNYLMRKYDNKHVSYERILSGPGLLNVYEFLRDTGKETEPDWLRDELAATPDKPAHVSKTALDAKAPIAEHALQIFVSVFGAEAGNVALKFMATGGVYIAGIAGKIVPAIQQGGFMQAFLDKGRMRHLLEDVPVKIILNDDAGLLGAARHTLIQKAFR